jgi:hypothetical protein
MVMAVPSLGKHDIIAQHPLIAGNKIDIAPIEGISDMEIAGRIRGRGIDDKLWAIRHRVKIMVLITPDALPAGLHLIKIVVLREFLWERHFSHICTGKKYSVRTIKRGY